MSRFASTAQTISRGTLFFPLRRFTRWTLMVWFFFWMLPLAWASGPTFTVANTTFSSIPVGQSSTQSVTLTLNSAVAIKSIALGSGITEYKLGTVTGCKTDGVTVNAAGAVCTIPVTYSPKAPGSIASPAVARSAPLLVTDVESGSAVTYAFGLIGAATGPIMQFTPATLTRVAGAGATGYPAGDEGFGSVPSAYGGDNGPATAASFAFQTLFSSSQEPSQPMAVDSAGNIFVVDAGNYIIRRIDGTSGTVTTVAGTPKTLGQTGDGGPATSATLFSVGSLALDAAGDIFFSDNAPKTITDGSYAIRMVNAGTGIITSIAGQNSQLPVVGSGTCVESGQFVTWEPTCGDGGLAANAFIYYPVGLAIDGVGNIYILESQGTIRKIDGQTGIITSIGNAVASKNGQAYGLTIGADGMLYATVYDTVSAINTLNRIDPASGAVTVVGGGGANTNAATCTAQGTTATDWFLDFNGALANGLSADGAGNIYASTTFCSGATGIVPGVFFYGSFRFNIATGLAYAYTSSPTQGGNGGTNGVYTSFGTSYAIYPSFAVADSAGNIYFQTFNQIAKLAGSQGALDGFGSRNDFQTDPAGTACSSFNSSCQTAVVANVGNAALDTSFALSTGYSFLTTGDSALCSTETLTPGDFCNLDIEFTPTTVGTINGTVTVTDNATAQGNGTQTLALVGTGVAAPEIAFTPASMSFGNQAVNTTSATQTVTISNGGTGPLTLEGIYVAATGVNFGVFTIPGGTCPTTFGSLAAGASCTVQIAFAPTAAGSYSAYLNINSNISTGILAATTLTGTGVTTTATAATPVISPASGTFNSAVSVTISDKTAGATIYYTTDGSTPSTSSTKYTGAFTVSRTGTNVQAIATATGYSNSAVALAVYDLQAIAPVFNPPGGTYATSQSVAITSATAGAAIYYTTNGIPPTTESALYNGPITVSVSGTTIQAIATLSGYDNSATTSATYTFASPSVSLAPSPLGFGGQVVGTTSATQAVALTNNGTGSLAITGISIAGINANAFAVGTGANACASTLGADEQCFIYLRFTPATAGSFTATLSVADNAAGTPQTVALTGTGVKFVSNVGEAMAAQAVTVNVGVAGTLGSVQVLTQGTAGLDFTQAPGGTCSTGTDYAVGATCTVEVIFTPQFSGRRTGAILLTDSGGNRLGTAYLPGTGIGPEIVFGPGAISTLPAPTSGSGYQSPLGIAADAGGNIFVSDSLNNRVVKLPKSGTGYGTPSVVPTTGLNHAGGIAVDGNGNVFIADTGNSRLVEVPWTGTAFGTQTALPAPVSQPEGVAVDGNGNVFIADTENKRLVELPWTGTGYGSAITTLATALEFPKGVAVDANENIYIADTDNDRIVELPWNGTAYGTQITLPTSNLNQPFSLAVGGGGNLYIADTNNRQVVELPWNGTSFGAQITLPIYNLTAASGVTVDGSGNIYVADGGNSDAVKLDVSDAPVLSFASTNVGSTSTDSPKTVSVTNIGNASLTFAAGGNPSYPANFPVNSKDASLCDSSTPLAEGASCDVSVNFTPTAAGSLTGNVVLTDNDLNVTGTSQSIAVSGTGIGQSVTVATPVISPGTGTYTTNQTVSITDTTAGATIYYSTDGSTPTASSTKYTGPFTVSRTGTNVQAIAEAVGDTNSAIALATYTLHAVTPVLSPPGGTYSGSQLVTITSATPGASIYYSTNGIAPTTESTLYSGPVSITQTGTVLQATATLSGYDNSPVASGTYVIQSFGASLTPASMTFTSNTGVATAAQTATLKNTGTAALTIGGIGIAGANPGDFSQTNTCGESLAAGASCTISVVFTPASVASFTATLTVADNAAGSPQTTSLSGTGTTPPPPNGDFSVSASPGAQTVTAGAAAKFAINVATTPAGDVFSNVVTLTATGLPAGATANFSPASVTPGTGSATSTLTVQTAASTSADGGRPRTGGPPWRAFTPSLAFVFGGFGLLLWRRRHGRLLRGLSSMMILAALGIGAWAMTGCGGGFAFPTKTTPPQTYTITVTGTSGETTHSTTVTLTVQQPAAQ
jgi:sugar lactone lactonase YvrE